MQQVEMIYKNIYSPAQKGQKNTENANKLSERAVRDENGVVIIHSREILKHNLRKNGGFWIDGYY